MLQPDPSPIDWGGRGEPRSIWDPEEPEEERPRRRWAVPAVLIVLAAGAVAVAMVIGGRGMASDERERLPAEPAVVRSLTASVVSPAEVRLTWSVSREAVEYVLFRDAVLLTTIRAPNLSFRDISVSPDRTYQYAVEAVDAAGRHSDRVIASVTTPPPPPLSQARLDGMWDITLEYEEENYTNKKRGDRERETWEFVPQCDEGSCDVRAHLPYEQLSRTVLRRSGTIYRGKGVADVDRCGRVFLSTEITLRVTVTEAEFVDGVWQATRITGRHQTESAAALNCAAGRGVRSVDGEARV